VRSDLLIPFALDPEDEITRPERAQRATLYRCPGCLSRVWFRRGPKRRPHFAHSSGFAGHGETEAHRLAKYHLADLLMALLPDPRPHLPIREPCTICSRRMRRRLPPFAQTKVEEPIANGRIADVALLGPGRELRAVLEVFVSHKTDPFRAAPTDVPWIEIAVVTPLDSTTWKVAEASRPAICGSCSKARLAPLATPSARQSPVPAPGPKKAAYRGTVVRCKACLADTRFYEWNGDVPPDPRPATVWPDRLPLPPERLTEGSFTPVQLERASQRWSNHCFHCDCVLDP
jgi:hypothetical protein